MNELLKTRMAEFFNRKFEEVNNILLQELQDKIDMDCLPENIVELKQFFDKIKTEMVEESHQRAYKQMDFWIKEFNDENIDLYLKHKISKEDVEMLLHKMNC